MAEFYLTRPYKVRSYRWVYKSKRIAFTSEGSIFDSGSRR